MMLMIRNRSSRSSSTNTKKTEAAAAAVQVLRGSDSVGSDNNKSRLLAWPTGVGKWSTPHLGGVYIDFGVLPK
jgi:hypothetical protein